MKLTKTEIKALNSISEWTKNGRMWSKSAASSTVYAIRSPQLEALDALGLIKSMMPFSWAYHSVTLTDAGRAALEDKPK